MKPQINVLIYDFDGVIVDSGADIATAVNYTLECFKRPVLPRDEIISYVGRGAENLLRSCFKGCDEELVKAALPEYKKYYLENCIVKTRLYDNVKETLEYFRDKKAGLVTNKPEALTVKILEGLEVKDYFKIIVAPETVNKMKPDPEGLFKVLDFYGEKPGKAIMIGDSYTDIETGKSAGTYTCGVTYGLGSTAELIKAQPDFIIDNMMDLKKIII